MKKTKRKVVKKIVKKKKKLTLLTRYNKKLNQIRGLRRNLKLADRNLVERDNTIESMRENPADVLKNAFCKIHNRLQQLEAWNDSIQNLESRADDIEERVESVEETTQETEGMVDELDGRTCDSEGLESRIEELEGRISDFEDLENRIENLENEKGEK